MGRGLGRDSSERRLVRLNRNADLQVGLQNKRAERSEAVLADSLSLGRGVG
jgi:hypothetical protein